MSDYRKHLYDPNSIEAKVSFGVISFVGIVAILGTLLYFDFLMAPSTQRGTLRVTGTFQEFLRN